jgi:hypothetical protein
MLRITVILVAILAFPITARTQEAASCVQPSPGNAQKCARIALAQEFVRELEIIYRLQEAVKQELAEDSSGPGKLATSIKVRTRMLFEMNDSIQALAQVTTPIIKLPMKIRRQCGHCGDFNSVLAEPGQAVPAFKCSACGYAAR